MLGLVVTAPLVVVIHSEPLGGPTGPLTDETAATLGLIQSPVLIATDAKRSLGTPGMGSHLAAANKLAVVSSTPWAGVRSRSLTLDTFGDAIFTLGHLLLANT